MGRPKKQLRLCLLISPFLSLWLGSCVHSNSSDFSDLYSEERFLLPEADLNQSQAEGAAYTGDGMLFRRPIPRRNTRVPDVDFYFKHCTLSERQSHYSKTSYTCFEPH